LFPFVNQGHKLTLKVPIWLDGDSIAPLSGAAFRENAKFTYTALESLAKLAISSEGTGNYLGGGLHWRGVCQYWSDIRKECLG
jgi:hypothetical protein